MTKDQIKLVRDLYHQDDGSGKPLAFSTSAVFNNEIAFVDTDHFVIWDDKNQLVHCLFPNTDSPVSSAISPYRISTGFFDNIQYIEGLIGMDNFETVIDKLFLETGLINEDKKKLILDWASSITNTVPTPDQVPYFKNTPIIVPSVPKDPPVRKDGIYPSAAKGSVTEQDAVNKTLHDIINNKATKTTMVRHGETTIYNCIAKTYEDIRDDILAIIDEMAKQPDFRYGFTDFLSVNSIFTNADELKYIKKYYTDTVINDFSKCNNTVITLSLRIGPYISDTISIFLNDDRYSPKVVEFKDTIKNIESSLNTSDTISIAGSVENPTYVFSDKEAMVNLFMDQIAAFDPKHVVINNTVVDCDGAFTENTYKKAMRKAADTDETPKENPAKVKLFDTIMKVINIKNRSYSTLNITLYRDHSTFKLPTYNIKYHSKEEDAMLPDSILDYDGSKLLVLDKDLVGAKIIVNKGEILTVDFLPNYEYTNLTIINNGILNLKSTQNRTTPITLDSSILNNAGAYLHIYGGNFVVQTGHGIDNKGYLAVYKGSNSIIAANAHKAAAVYARAGSETHLNGGSYLRPFEAGTSSKNSGGNSYYYIYNEGNMTLDGITVNSTGFYSSLVQNKGIMVVKDCDLTNGHTVVKNEHIIEVYDCLLNSLGDHDIIQNWGIADIHDINTITGKMSTYSIATVKTPSECNIHDCSFAHVQVISWDKKTKPSLTTLDVNMYEGLKVDSNEVFVNLSNGYVNKLEVIDNDLGTPDFENKIGVFYKNTKIDTNNQYAINLDNYTPPVKEEVKEEVEKPTTPSEGDGSEDNSTDVSGQILSPLT